MKNWKTSFVGATIVGLQIASVIWPAYSGKFQHIAMILAGSGLLLAKDHNSTEQPSK